jgi:hypothetical protein
MNAPPGRELLRGQCRVVVGMVGALGHGLLGPESLAEALEIQLDGMLDALRQNSDLLVAGWLAGEAER